MPLFRARALALAVLCAHGAACGGSDGEAYETARTELRSSGGDEAILDDGFSIPLDPGAPLTAPLATLDEFRVALAKAKALRTSQISRLAPETPAARRLLAEANAIDQKLANADAALHQQREQLAVVERALHVFIFRFAPGRDWEMRYALRSGDLRLAAATVLDVLSRLDEASFTDRPDSRAQDVVEGRLKAQTLAADALHQLARLAVRSAEFADAERFFKACLALESTPERRAEALQDYEALRAAEGRDEDARTPAKP